jgi:hypothetical protein
MLIGGVIIAAGMQLNMKLSAQDVIGAGPAVLFTITRVVAYDAGWVALEGWMLPTPTTAWAPGHIAVRVDSLKRLLTQDAA